jgi:hypothetical protein
MTMTRSASSHPPGVARGSTRELILLSRFLLCPAECDGSSPVATQRTLYAAQELLGVISTSHRLADLLALAHSHHVIVRWLRLSEEMIKAAGDARLGEYAAKAAAMEHARIEHALPFLRSICTELEAAGSPVVVIKSLDHWPDLGSDLDLLAHAEPNDVIGTMSSRFSAQLAPRSWGDRLANKWNFIVPGLPELVEIHIGRLGQTGEQIALAESVIARAGDRTVGSYTFRVPAAEDRLLITTLQRMYRHFYLRLCDIVDTVQLVEARAVNYAELRRSAQAAGIWEGAATFLLLVSEYARSYRGVGLDLPPWLRASARFDGKHLAFSHGFLRIPIFPDSISLYVSELARSFQHREIRGALRLSLLPGLATAAALGQRITGSDKGVW